MAINLAFFEGESQLNTLRLNLPMRRLSDRRKPRAPSQPPSCQPDKVINNRALFSLNELERYLDERSVIPISPALGLPVLRHF